MREPNADTDRPALVEMLEQVVDLGTSLGILAVPLFSIALPGVLLFLVLPAVLLIAAAAVPVAAAAALLAPPYLLVRAVRRASGRSRTPNPHRHYPGARARSWPR
jgi:cell division protein FtsW (lipid II flippase)